MPLKSRLLLAVSAALYFLSSAAQAQLPPLPIGGPPVGAPPPLAGGPPPALGAPRPPGPGAPARGAGLGAGLGSAGARGGPVVVNSARTASVNIGRASGYGSLYAGRYEARAAAYAGAYAAGAYADYAYGGSRSSYYSSSDCYYIYKRSRRILVCD